MTTVEISHTPILVSLKKDLQRRIPVENPLRRVSAGLHGALDSVLDLGMGRESYTLPSGHTVYTLPITPDNSTVQDGVMYQIAKNGTRVGFTTLFANSNREPIVFASTSHGENPRPNSAEAIGLAEQLVNECITEQTVDGEVTRIVPPRRHEELLTMAAFFKSSETVVESDKAA
jgi:hypothetical protein